MARTRGFGEVEGGVQQHRSSSIASMIGVNDVVALKDRTRGIIHRLAALSPDGARLHFSGALVLGHDHAGRRGDAFR